MKSMSLAVVALTSLSLLLGGCAGQDEASNEPVAQSEDKLIGVLTSPIGVEDQHIDGTWVPVDGDEFVGQPFEMQFSKQDGARAYRFGPKECAGSACNAQGTWFISDNPVAWFFAGTYVVFKPTGSDQEMSVFIWRKANGEIRLVDLNSWSWSRLEYRNTWRKTPALTVGDL